MSLDLLRNDIVSLWFWGYRGDWRIELQAPVVWLTDHCTRPPRIESAQGVDAYSIDAKCSL